MLSDDHLLAVDDVDALAHLTLADLLSGDCISILRGTDSAGENRADGICALLLAVDLDVVTVFVVAAERCICHIVADIAVHILCLEGNQGIAIGDADGADGIVTRFASGVELRA